MRREHKIRVWRCSAFVGLFLCFLLGLGLGAHAQNANDILRKAAAAYENSNGISASFTMFTRSAGQNAGESFEGTIQMKGDKFTLVTPEALTWFNGTTQWTYVERNDEVNVTNPTGEELQFTNPALLLNSYKKGFTAAYKGESTAPNGNAAYDVEFRHVSFSYENTEQGTRTEALRDVSFIAPQGKITALVGPSGSGKSTVANLIPRFWDVEQGKICIGGADIRQIPTAKLMDMVSFVFQDTFLFYDTLYENIAVGSPDATKEKVIAAAKAAQCHDFIERLPQGYETRIGDKGVFLSGGEAQRICVARAILKNAPILVLDEATAFADPENEHKMQMALQSLIKDKTVIVIAHRLSSIISAHQIVVMKEGRIVQCGKHEQLSVTEGVYKNMWDAYTSAYHWTLNKN